MRKYPICAFRLMKNGCFSKNLLMFEHCHKFPEITKWICCEREEEETMRRTQYPKSTEKTRKQQHLNREERKNEKKERKKHWAMSRSSDINFMWKNLILYTKSFTDDDYKFTRQLAHSLQFLYRFAFISLAEM